MQTIKPHHILLILILLAGAAIRIYGAATMPFNLDERWHIYPAAMAGSLLEAIQLNAKFDGHPILTPVWLYSMLQVNDSLLWLRLPSVIAGIALIAVCFRLGRYISGHNFGLAFAGLVAFAYMPMVQAQLVRGYSIMLLCTAIAYYAALKYERENRWLWLYTLVMCVSVSIIISSIAFAAAVGTVYFFKWIYERARWQKLALWCSAHALILMVFAANYWMTNVYGGASGLMWIGKDFMVSATPAWDVVATALRYMVMNSFGLIFYQALETQFYIGLPVLLLCALIPSFTIRRPELRLHTALWLASIGYIAVMELVAPNSSAILRRSSFVLIPCFILLLFIIKFLLAEGVQKLPALRVITPTKLRLACVGIGTLALAGNLALHSFYWKDDDDEFYLMTQSNDYYFQFMQENDILITDGISVFELLYPNRAKITRLSPLVRKVEGYSLPIYTFGYDPRELQSVMTLHAWQNYLRALDTAGAFDGREMVWVWRKTPPWGTEIQAELLCDLPQKNLFRAVISPEASGRAEADLQKVQQLVRAEAGRTTKPIFLKRAQVSDCNHVFYGLSVDFIRNTLLTMPLYQYDHELVTQMRNSGTWRAEFKARHIEKFFDRLYGKQ